MHGLATIRRLNDEATTTATRQPDWDRERRYQQLALAGRVPQDRLGDLSVVDDIDNPISIAV